MDTRDKQTNVAGVRPVPRVDAGSILSAGKEVILVHKDTEYRLRVTRNGKLILTK